MALLTHINIISTLIANYNLAQVVLLDLVLKQLYNCSKPYHNTNQLALIEQLTMTMIDPRVTFSTILVKNAITTRTLQLNVSAIHRWHHTASYLIMARNLCNHNNQD